MTFSEWLKSPDGIRAMWGAPANGEAILRVGWNAAIAEAREAALGTAKDAHEAAKAKDATDYVAGYQDATVEVDECLRLLIAEPPR